ncbi:hypothetical protein BTL_5510 [Burkholderia thailandensis H0587]|nr:hypothetical protein BTL_5510 [Burkholderia thailandensis H0587]
MPQRGRRRLDSSDSLGLRARGRVRAAGRRPTARLAGAAAFGRRRRTWIDARAMHLRRRIALPSGRESTTAHTTRIARKAGNRRRRRRKIGRRRWEVARDWRKVARGRGGRRGPRVRSLAVRSHAGGDGCWAGGAIARLGAVSAFRYAGGSRSIAARMSESVSAPVIRTGNLEMSSRRGPKRACAGFDIVRCARDDSGFAPGRSRGLLAMPSTGAPGARRRAGVRRASIVGPRRYARCPHPTIRPSFANIPCRAIHSAYAR